MPIVDENEELKRLYSARKLSEIVSDQDLFKEYEALGFRGRSMTKIRNEVRRTLLKISTLYYLSNTELALLTALDLIDCDKVTTSKGLAYLFLAFDPEHKENGYCYSCDFHPRPESEALCAYCNEEPTFSEIRSGEIKK